MEKRFLNALDFMRMILLRNKEVASMMKYCEACGRCADTRVTDKKEIYEVCGERIEVDAR